MLRSTLRQRIRRWLLRMFGAVLRQFVPKHPRPLGAEHILVIKPDHLGDVLLLTPALRLLRQQRPAARISLLIGPWSRAAVQHNPDIDLVQTCSFPGFTRMPKTSLVQPYLLAFQTAMLLRLGGYDAALIARDDHWWGALVAALAGIPRRIGYSVPETAPFLTRALPCRGDQHVTRQSIALVEALTGEAAQSHPHMRAPIGAHDREWADSWLVAHGIASGQLVAIHPGAGGAAKLWLAQHWAEVATRLQRRGLTVILTGGSGERTLVEDIMRRMESPPLELVGTATVGQLAALYACCTLVLGVDSGPLHLAAAAGAGTLSLFGPSDQQRFGPWGDPQRQRILRSELWCSPCGVLHACPRGTAPSECMTRIAVAQVLAAIEQQISRAEASIAVNAPVETSYGGDITEEPVAQSAYPI